MEGILDTLVCNKAQSSCLLNRVHLCSSLLLSRGKQIKHETAKMLAILVVKILKFLLQFQSVEYVYNNWTKTLDRDKFDYFHKELNYVFVALHRKLKYAALSLKRRRIAEIEDYKGMRKVMMDDAAKYDSVKFGETRELTPEMLHSLHLLERIPDYKMSKVKELIKLRTINIYEMSGSVPFKHLRLIPVYVKTIHRSPNKGLKQIQLFLEAMVLQAHNLPGVIRLYGVDSAIAPTMLVMERARCSLSDAIYNPYRSGVKLTIERKLSWLLEVCSTLAFLHNNGVIHRNITPDNILIMWNSQIKLTNFGIANGNPFCFHSLQNVKNESFPYVAPELILTRDKYNYNEATDMYAFAIVMNELFTQLKPYDDVNDIQSLIFEQRMYCRPYYTLAYHSAELGSNYMNMKDGCEALLEQCWDHYPTKRLSFERASLKLFSLHTSIN